MIHRVALPPATKQALGQIVRIQIELLKYAAATNPAIRGSRFSKQGCIQALNLVPELGSQGKAIVEWLIGPKPKSPRARWKNLRTFAHHPNVTEKQNLVTPLVADMEAMRGKKPPTGQLTLFTATNSWALACKNFLMNFYAEIGSKKAKGFPKALTGDLSRWSSTWTSFSRREFLSSFAGKNEHLTVCPMCDEGTFLTFDDLDIATEVDHYFPKSLYPHLAIHPYNLVPICGTCNGHMKGDKDPLKRPGGGRFRLDRVQLPYRRSALRSGTLLRFKRSGNVMVTMTERQTTGRASSRLQAHRRLVKIPGRWSSRPNLDPTLLSLTLEWLKDRCPTPVTPTAVVDLLDRYVGVLHEYYVGRQPFMLTLAWWVAEQARVLNKGRTASSALYRELLRAAGMNPSTVLRLQQKGLKMRRMLR